MIGHQPTGTIQGVLVTAVAHEGLTVMVDGKPARLAVVLDDGTVVAAGKPLAKEVQAVTINLYRQFLQGNGHLRVVSQAIPAESH